MLKTMVRNLRDHNQKLVALPRDFEDIKAMFEEQFGFCNARGEQDFECDGLYSEYGEDEQTYSLAYANDVATRFERYESELGSNYLQAFFELDSFSYADLDMIDEGSISFYSSKEEYLYAVYERYGLTDTKFLWTTVDAFLNDDYVFRELEMNGNLFQASNGVIVEVN